jgi:hypothetical protein
VKVRLAIFKMDTGLRLYNPAKRAGYLPCMLRLVEKGTEHRQECQTFLKNILDIPLREAHKKYLYLKQQVRDLEPLCQQAVLAGRKRELAGRKREEQAQVLLKRFDSFRTDLTSYQSLKRSMTRSEAIAPMNNDKFLAMEQRLKAEQAAIVEEAKKLGITAQFDRDGWVVP